MTHLGRWLAMAGLVGGLTLGTGTAAGAQEPAEPAATMPADFDAGMARAAAERKPLFVVFDHPW